MTSLRPNLVKRIERLPKPKNVASALQPLFEAISNAIHSTQDKFRDKVAQDGRVIVTVSTDRQKDDVWATVEDIFLMRYISVVDCALLLSNEIFETGLERRKCSIGNLKKQGIPRRVISLLEELRADQGVLRDERNARFHHGIERGITGDDMTFQTAALFEHRGRGIRGLDQDGRRINVERSFREGLVEQQREFNQVTRKLVSQLERLYDQLGTEFETRFIPRFRAGPFVANEPLGWTT